MESVGVCCRKPRSPPVLRKFWRNTVDAAGRWSGRQAADRGLQLMSVTPATENSSETRAPALGNTASDGQTEGQVLGRAVRESNFHEEVSPRLLPAS